MITRRCAGPLWLLCLALVGCGEPGEEATPAQQTRSSVSTSRRVKVLQLTGSVEPGPGGALSPPFLIGVRDLSGDERGDLRSTMPDGSFFIPIRVFEDSRLELSVYPGPIWSNDSNRPSFFTEAPLARVDLSADQEGPIVLKPEIPHGFTEVSGVLSGCQEGWRSEWEFFFHISGGVSPTSCRFDLGLVGIGSQLLVRGRRSNGFEAIFYRHSLDCLDCSSVTLPRPEAELGTLDVAWNGELPEGANEADVRLKILGEQESVSWVHDWDEPFDVPVGRYQMWLLDPVAELPVSEGATVDIVAGGRHDVTLPLRGQRK